MLGVMQPQAATPASDIGVIREAQDVLHIGIAIFDSNLCLVSCNRSYRELLCLPTELCQRGAALEAIFRYNARRGEYGAGDPEALVQERLALARQFKPHSYHRARPDGTVFEVNGYPLPSGGFVTTYTDITQVTRATEMLAEKEQDLIKHIEDLEIEQEMIEQQAQQIVQMAEDLAVQNKEIEASRQQSDFQAKHDELTGLPNRRFFTDQLKQTLERAGRVGTSKALLFVDLDNFKPVNDVLGHVQGDRVLREVALALLKSVRDSDFVARVGGDEFAVIAGMKPENGLKGVQVVAERILSAVSMAVGGAEHGITISASIGVSLFPQDAKASAELLRLADKAMYAAKAASRNRIVFASELMPD